MEFERRTARMWVRPLAPADREEWVRASVLSEPLVGPWSPARPADFTWDAQFDRMIEQNAGGHSLRLVGFLPDRRLAGWFNLSGITRGPFQNAYAGWSVSAEVAGLGYATEGVRALLDIAFTAGPTGLGLHRVQAGVIPRNVRSVRVAEKCGFRLEGRAVRYLEIAGVYEDHLLYARLAEER